MDLIEAHLKEILIILGWLIVVGLIYLRIFGRRLLGQYSGTILRAKNEDFIISGIPDRILKKKGQIIIFEYKSRKAPPKPYQDHVIQLGTYFYLFEVTFNKRADYGVIKYKDREFRIKNSDDLRNRVIRTIEKFITQTSSPESIKRNHQNYGKCHNCAHRIICKQSLVKK